jgi:glycosyltransferase involved in cell wall biosynthesis
LKVLHVINSLVAGGAERLLSDLLPSIARLGFDVGLVVLDARNDVFSDQLREAGIAVSFVNTRGGSIYSPLRIPELALAIQQRQPDIIHTHLAPGFHWAAWTGRGSVLMATEHATHNRRMGLPLVRGFERFVYKRYDRVVCVSPDTAAALSGWLGLPLDHFPVIPNGIPLARFAVHHEAAIDVTQWLRGRRAIGMTARLIQAKGHDIALAALALLPASWCMVFAGDGPERQALELLARKLGVEDRCLFLGARMDIPAILAACAVYLQSSYAEGFGIAALEAMAAGLPVVASEAPGLAELVRDAGVLFASGDAQGCCRAILKASGDAGLYVAKGLTRAAQYSIERCADSYARLYIDRAAAGQTGIR